MRRLYQLSIFITLFLSLIGSAAGPRTGGGGGSVVILGKPRLVDFLNIPESHSYLDKKYKNLTPSFIDSITTLSFESSGFPNDAAFVLAQSTFDQWSRLPYDYIGLLINTGLFKPVSWHFVDSEMPASDHFRPAALDSTHSIQTTAYYLMKDRAFDVFISRSLWNNLPLADQAGLLIHESLRHIQIGFSLSFDDESLQRATAILMSCRPTITLDQYLFFLLQNRRDLADARFERFEILTKDCGK